MRLFDSSPRRVPGFATIAKFSAALALILLAVAFALGILEVDRDGVVGDVIFPALGVGTLLAGVGAFLAGVVALFREQSRSMGTILATIAGTFISGLMIFELFIEH